MRRFLIFLLYDPDGIVDEGVLHTLTGFRNHVERIFVVVNGFLLPDQREKLANVCDEILERENIGFDVGAYRAALGKVGQAELAKYDELLLVNYTFFGPITTFDELFERMDDRALDFWGITEHVAVTPHPFTGVGTMPSHIQSYWLALRNRLFTSEEFAQYWTKIADAHSYNAVVTLFETEFTRHFAQLGFVWGVAFPSEPYGVLNASIEAADMLLEDGSPLFKRRLFFHEVVDLDHRGVSVAEIAQHALELDFPRDVIVDGIIRRTPPRALAVGLGLMVIVPPDSSSRSPRVTVRQGMPWLEWLRDGNDVFEGKEFLAVAAPPVQPGERSDGHAGRIRRSNHSTVDNTAAIVEALDADPRLGVIVPLTEHGGTDLLQRGWRGQGDAAARLAERLGLRGPLEIDSPLTPLMGSAVYRAAALEQLPSLVARSGGWKQLSAAFGGDERLTLLFDLIAADVARNAGFLTSEAATVQQLVNSHELLQYKFGAVAARFDPGSRPPFEQGLSRTGKRTRARVGKWMREKSPRLARVLITGEKASRAVVKRGLDRLRKSGGEDRLE